MDEACSYATCIPSSLSLAIHFWPEPEINRQKLRKLRSRKSRAGSATAEYVAACQMCDCGACS